MSIEQLENGKYKLTVKPNSLNNNFSFEEQKDKFLFNKNKTIGFRKDKKLNKFVGLRSGYSKQLELSIISVILDGVDKIPKSRVNFNSVSVEDDVIIHNINNTIFYNTVSDTNYKNMIQIKSPFKNLEILYEITTKGLKVLNRLGGNRYSSINNEFVFVDEGNNTPIFIINTPVILDADGNEYKVVDHKLFLENDRLYYKKTVGLISNKLKFPLLIDANITFNIDVDLSSSGIGVLSSTDSVWSNVINGTGTLSLAHNSSVGTYEYAVGASENSGTYTLNRTYLTFDTSNFSGYTDVLSSVKLLMDNYWSSDEGIVVMKGTHNNIISTSDWNNYGDYYTDIVSIDSGTINEFNLPLSSLNLTGFTKLVLLSYSHDYNNMAPDTNVFSYTGIDFGNTKLEVTYDPIRVYGQTTINVQRGGYFSLSGYTNSGSSTDILWFKDSGYTNFITSGSSMVGYSMEYEVNDKIYAVIPISGGTEYSVPLIVTVIIIKLDYDVLPDKIIDYDKIDIDSIYFKYHKCLSGVCYTYVRDINNIYEGFPLVSDSWGNESYNLYNEFDIIDEFFSNSHEVEVAYNQNLDLTTRHNDLDGVILREGTRVLLTNQTDLTELGVYVVQFDNTLVKTDELNTYEDCFRYKALVGAGTYADQEIHIWPILPPPENEYITLTPNPISFIYLSGISSTVTVTTNTSWTLYENIPWVNVNTSHGTGVGIITLTTVMTNNTTTTRSGVIEFTGYNGTTTILTVEQTPNLGEDFRVTTEGDGRITTEGDDRIVL